MWPARAVGQTGDVIILLELHIFMSWPAHVLFLYLTSGSPRGPSAPGRVCGCLAERWLYGEREKEREKEIEKIERKRMDGYASFANSFSVHCTLLGAPVPKWNTHMRIDTWAHTPIHYWSLENHFGWGLALWTVFMSGHSAHCCNVTSELSVLLHYKASFIFSTYRAHPDLKWPAHVLFF